MRSPISSARLPRRFVEQLRAGTRRGGRERRAACRARAAAPACARRIPARRGSSAIAAASASAAAVASSSARVARSCPRRPPRRRARTVATGAPRPARPRSAAVASAVTAARRRSNFARSSTGGIALGERGARGGAQLDEPAEHLVHRHAERADLVHRGDVAVELGAQLARAAPRSPFGPAPRTKCPIERARQRSRCTCARSVSGRQMLGEPAGEALPRSRRARVARR